MSPGRAGILFSFEIVVGVASAAVLTSEPFGTRELIGTILIIGAAIIEVLRKQEVEELPEISCGEPVCLADQPTTQFCSGIISGRLDVSFLSR